MQGKRTGRLDIGLVGCFTLALTLVLATACYSPRSSQQFFVRAAAEDPNLELIYQTALYSVFFDRALQRCVVHSAHTWGEQGGGGGGTGIGIEAFRCDPRRISARLDPNWSPPSAKPDTTQPPKQAVAPATPKPRTTAPEAGPQSTRERPPAPQGETP